MRRANYLLSLLATAEPFIMSAGAALRSVGRFLSAAPSTGSPLRQLLPGRRQRSAPEVTFARKTQALQTHGCRQFGNKRVMPSNVEIKAKVSNPAQFAEKAASLSQSEGTIIRQHDTFFEGARGRLKLRDFKDGSGQLIYYERPDTDGPKLSRYSISPTSDPSSLRNVLSDALGIKGEVKKERRLFLIGQTRVHLDAVEGLGDYMELEVVMRPDQTVEEGQKVKQQVAEDLMEKLGVAKESLVTGAYMDLLLKETKEA